MPTRVLDGFLEPIVVTISREQSPREMRMKTLAAMAGAPRDLVLDLRTAARLTDLDVALLMGIGARQHARSRALTLVCGPESTTQEVLSRSGLSDQFSTVTALPSDSQVAVTTEQS